MPTSNERLLDAAFNGQEAMVRHLLPMNDVNINWQNEQGDTALHRAAVYGHIHILNLLLEHGAQQSVHTQNNTGMTALHVACMYGKHDFASLLHQRGSDINGTDGKGNTPLHLAAAHIHVDTIRFLVDSGANLQLQNEEGLNPVETLNGTNWHNLENAGNIEMLIQALQGVLQND